MDSAQSSDTLIEPKDAGDGDEGLVKRWNMEWDLASKTEENWRKAAKDVITRYRGTTDNAKTKFNILFSNTQVMVPAIYNSTPKPDVRRRFRDPDPLAKVACEVLERSLAYTLDAQDFDSVMLSAVLDYALPGRGITRVRYVPTFSGYEGSDEGKDGDQPAPDTGISEADLPDEDYETLAWEEVCFEHVQWKDFRRGPGRRWEDVCWVGFDHFLTKAEAKEKFGPVFDEVEPDAVVDGASEEQAKTNPDVFKRFNVREIWDRDERKVYFIAPSIKEKPLKVEDDPLRLQGFFPIPRPLYAVETTDSLEPIEEFRLYKDQADELDRVTARINRLINGLKLRGIYDATVKEFELIMKSDDNALLPAQDATTLVTMQGGGLDKAVWMLPIDKAAAVLVELYRQREQIKSTIYEIMGIADIMRGASDPRETLGAQQIKATFGSGRLQKRQRDVQRYARDLVRITAEIISEHFSVDILRAMTNINLPTRNEIAAQTMALKAQIVAAQQVAPPVPGQMPNQAAPIPTQQPPMQAINPVPNAA